MLKHIKDFIIELGKSFLKSTGNFLLRISIISIISALSITIAFLLSLLVGYIHWSLFEKDYTIVLEIFRYSTFDIKLLCIIGLIDLLLGTAFGAFIIIILGIIAKIVYGIFKYLRSIWNQTHEK